MSAFRQLAPSNQQDEAAPSPSFRFIREDTSPSVGVDGVSGDAGGGTSQDAGGDNGNGGDKGQNRKRRAPGSVSLMACNPCRQARQRCDGQRPEICSRCLQRKLECVYEPHTKTHKDDLIREIEHLRGHNANLQNRYKAIEEIAAENDTINQSLREEGHWQRIILRTIGSNGHDREIIKKLRAGESHQAIADWLVQENPDFGALGLQPTTHDKLVDIVKLVENQYQEEDSISQPNSSESRFSWTKVITNEVFVSHLINLYFTWVHPVHMFFSESHFKEDFKSNRENHCSISLVNAICAMACNLLQVDHGEDRRSQLDVAILRDGFMAEARKLLVPNSYSCMTSIQTFAVMFLVELSSGKARNAIGYLRSAIENMGLQDDPRHSKEAKELMFWGVQTLNSVCAGMTYQKFYTPPVPGDPIFQHIRVDKDVAEWRFYRELGDERDLQAREGHAIVTACHQARLFRIVNETLNLYCGTRGQVSAYKVLDLYRRYLDWKEALPPVIANVGEGDQPLPHILHLHVQYHTALVQLFRPLVYGRFFTDSDEAEMKRIVVFHARSGVEPLGHAQRLYTARYSLPLLSFCLVHLCDALLSYSPEEPPASETVTFCLQILQQTRSGFALCGPLQCLFHHRAEECGVTVPEELKGLVKTFDHYAVDDILDTCTRLSYTEPLDQIIRYIDPNLANEWPGEWETQIIGRKRGERDLQINNILNA